MNVTTPLPQLTVKAIVLGLVLSALLAGANAYLGMFAGLTVAASIPAAVISMAVLRLWRNSNILENNMVQTIASAGESLAAGVIFTIPALVLLGYWRVFDYWWVTVIAGLGGLLGVLFTIPLRRALIVEQQLAYPEGTATAEVLKVGDAPGRGALQLAFAALLGAAVKFAETGLRLWPGTAQGATYVGGSTIAYVGTNLSPALLGVGYIIGLNIAALVFIGGALSWYVAIPIYSTWFLDSNPGLAAQFAAGIPATDLAGAIWATEIRYLGVGAMLIGGLWALLKLRKSIWSGISTSLRATPLRDAPVLDHRDQDVPLRFVLGGIVLFVLPIAALYYAIVGTVGIAFAMTIVMVLAGFLFSAVSSYMAGLVGSSNNPVSGITIATILLTSLLLLGTDGPRRKSWPGGSDHGRRRRLLRGCDRCRHDAGSSRRLFTRCDAMAAAGRAGARRRRSGARDGANPELAPERLRHRRAHGRAAERVAGTAGESNGIRGARRVRRRVAVANDRLRRARRCCDHRARCLPRAAPSRSSARRC